MNDEIKIQVHLESLNEPNKREKGLAKVYVKIGAKYFPEKNWDDFLFFMLPDWSYLLMKMIKGESKEEILSFVDGQYAIKITRDLTSSCIADLGKWDQFNNIFESDFSKKIDFFAFCSELAKANSLTIDYMESNKYESSYFKAVKIWGDNLRLALASSKT